MAVTYVIGLVSNLVNRYISLAGCEFDGQMYSDGAELSSYCVPLVCRGGNWTHSQKIEECCECCNELQCGTFE